MRILNKFFREQYNSPLKEHFKSILYGATLFIQSEGSSTYTIHFSDDTRLLAVRIGSSIKKSVDNV